MKKFLYTSELENELIDEIGNSICATKIPQCPKTLLQEILCDADTYNLGTKEFTITDNLLKLEAKARNMSINNWEEKTLEFLLSHKYFTTYCQALLGKGKQCNIDFIRNILTHKN